MLAHGRTIDDFLHDRAEILEAENSEYLGSDLQLTPAENSANSILMAHKINELEGAFESDNFLPSRNFYTVKTKIEESDVFQFIKAMPKGGALHTHEFSTASIDWVIANLTYR